jgi:hypothetical protein
MIEEMEFRVEPYSLKIKDINIEICPCCDMILQQNIRKGNYLIRECGYCRYLDRPFGGCGNTALTHYGGCSCEYGEKEFLYITCERCKSLKCIDCKTVLSCRNKNCSIPTRCIDCCKKHEFNNKWNNTTAQEKLNFYGTTKLKILAKNKNIKGYSKYKKDELINILSPLVNKNDFPIKSKIN